MEKVEYPVTEQFQDHDQQHETAHLGMWLFLATEIMMFGGLLVVIWYTRTNHSHGAGEAVAHLHYRLAGLNSALLLGSSLVITLAAAAARDGRTRRLKGLLLAASALAALFLGIKGYEYLSEYREQLMPWQASPLHAPAARLFLNLYLVATGLHALHVTVALVLALLFWSRLYLGRLQVPQRVTLFGAFAHYWHLVDVIWIFLYPSLYLIGRAA